MYKILGSHRAVPEDSIFLLCEAELLGEWLSQLAYTLASSCQIIYFILLTHSFNFIVHRLC